MRSERRGARMERRAPRSVAASDPGDLLPQGSGLIRTSQDLIDHVVAATPGRVQTINLHHLQLARQDESFAEATELAAYFTADGWPVAWLVARRFGRPIRRVTGSDLVSSIAHEERLHGRRWAVYGATPESVQSLSQAMARSGQELRVRETGRWETWDATGEAKRCRDAGVTSVLIAISQPHTEIFAQQLIASAPELQVIGVGAGVQMFSGEISRAPGLMQSMNLEWLFRLMVDPQRLWNRYVREGVPFFFRHIVPALI